MNNIYFQCKVCVYAHVELCEIILNKSIWSSKPVVSTVSERLPRWNVPHIMGTTNENVLLWLWNNELLKLKKWAFFNTKCPDVKHSD